LLAVERRLDAELQQARRRAEGILRTAEDEQRREDERCESELAVTVESRRAAHRARLEARRGALRERAECLVAALERLDEAGVTALADELLEQALASGPEVGP
jgi:hypothetical protein